jgi:DNA-binding response OmpR family regulator
MSVSGSIRLLVAVRPSAVGHYREHLEPDGRLAVTVVDTEAAAQAVLNDETRIPDVLAVDRGLCDTNALVADLRRGPSRLMVIVLDEDADFATPGPADDVSTDPWHDDELVKKILRLVEERSVATLRADALPGVRSFVKALRKATRSTSKQQAAVSAVKDLGYDHVAYYAILPGEQLSLSLAAQSCPDEMDGALPQHEDENGLLGYVTQTGLSKVVHPGDTPGHPLLDSGQYGAAVCAPVGSTIRFGVMLAFREAHAAVSGDDIVMLELINAQLASALVRDQRK